MYKKVGPVFALEFITEHWYIYIVSVLWSPFSSCYVCWLWEWGECVCVCGLSW